MKSFFFLLLTIILICATLSLDVLAKHFYLYWTTNWIDQSIHFLGGISVGFLFLWFFIFSGLFKSSNLNTKGARTSFLIYLSIVSILWEIYEYRIGLTHYSIPFIFDTISDLSMDLFGGILVYLLASKIYFK